MEDPILISEKNPEINSLNWIPVTLAFIYGVGALVTLIWLSLSTCRLIQLIRTSEKKQFGNYVLVIPQQPTAHLAGVNILLFQQLTTLNSPKKYSSTKRCIYEIIILWTYCLCRYSCLFIGLILSFGY